MPLVLSYIPTTVLFQIINWTGRTVQLNLLLFPWVLWTCADFSIYFFSISLLRSLHSSVSPIFLPNDKHNCLHQVSSASSVSSCELSGPACCDRARAHAGSVSLSEPITGDGNGMLVWVCACGLAALCSWRIFFYRRYPCRKSKCLIHFKLQRMCSTGQD